MLSNFTGLLVFLGGLIIVGLLMPRERIKELLMIGLIGGFGTALLLIYLMQNVFNFWIFRNVDLISIGKIPIFLAATWIPLVLLFVHFIIQYKHSLTRVLILIAFSLIAMLSHFFMITIGVLTYNNWSLISTFFIAFAILVGLLGYLYMTKQTKTIL